MVFTSGSKKTAYRRLFSALIALSIMLSSVLFASCSRNTGFHGFPGGAPAATAEPDNAVEQDNDPSALEPEYEFLPIDVSSWNGEVPMPAFYGSIDYTVESISVKRPVFIGENSARLNASLRAAFTAFAEECAADYPNGSIEFEIAFCEQGFISAWMILQCLRPAGPVPSLVTEIERRPFNYDVTCGRQITDLSDAFGSALSAANAEKLAQLITDAAVAQDYSLLCRIDPVSAAQIYVFGLSDKEDGIESSELRYGICFYYRQYELALPSQGCPLVFIGINTLRQFSASNSPVRRLSSAVPPPVEIEPEE